ncbi:MAG: hypothetical protein SYR96_24215 [Actinomycetota bacterium]|nr:hypothetical protein [Actinomycetota bacterium]
MATRVPAGLTAALTVTAVADGCARPGTTPEPSVVAVPWKQTFAEVIEQISGTPQQRQAGGRPAVKRVAGRTRPVERCLPTSSTAGPTAHSRHLAQVHPEHDDGQTAWGVLGY